MNCWTSINPAFMNKSSHISNYLCIFSLLLSQMARDKLPITPSEWHGQPGSTSFFSPGSSLGSTKRRGSRGNKVDITHS